MQWYWSFKRRNWKEITEQRYHECWYQLGGSVATHPDFVRVLSSIAKQPVKYWALHDKVTQNPIPIMVFPAWGQYLALSKVVLKTFNKVKPFDLGNAEVILPSSMEKTIKVPFKAHVLSHLHHGHVDGLKEEPFKLAMVRERSALNAKFLSTERRKRKKLIDAGGEVIPITDLSAHEISDWYAALFQMRWQRTAPAVETLSEVIKQLHTHLMGFAVAVRGKPAAIQIVYAVESPMWLSVEFINGGVDPEFEDLSPGSILLHDNVVSAYEKSESLNKALRYSFGRADRDYKSRWCTPISVWHL